MLTLQNDPPGLDSGADDEHQYKTYGKTLRKMINQCLRKDPLERPSAKDLLKHDFFAKKAKDKVGFMRCLVLTKACQVFIHVSISNINTLRKHGS